MLDNFHRLVIKIGATLQKGNRLLPVGLTGVAGSFNRGDAVIIRNLGGFELGRGLVAYSAQEATTIMGCRSSEIAATLGYHGRSVMVYRDDMVLFSVVSENV